MAELITYLGDMSSLDIKIGMSIKELRELGHNDVANVDNVSEDLPIFAPPGHSFNNKIDNYCLFYGRDRGEESGPKMNEEFLNLDYGQDYEYLWLKTNWYIRPHGYTDWYLLKDVLEFIRNNSDVESCWDDNLKPKLLHQHVNSLCAEILSAEKTYTMENIPN